VCRGTGFLQRQGSHVVHPLPSPPPPPPASWNQVLGLVGGAAEAIEGALGAAGAVAATLAAQPRAPELARLAEHKASGGDVGSASVGLGGPDPQVIRLVRYMRLHDPAAVRCCIATLGAASQAAANAVPGRPPALRAFLGPEGSPSRPQRRRRGGPGLRHSCGAPQRVPGAARVRCDAAHPRARALRGPRARVGSSTRAARVPERARWGGARGSRRTT